MSTAETLKSTIDRSKVQLELARADRDENAENWHAELIRHAKEEMEAQSRLDAERVSWAMKTRSSRTMATPHGPLFQERGLFDDAD